MKNELNNQASFNFLPIFIRTIVFEALLNAHILLGYHFPDKKILPQYIYRCMFDFIGK